MSASTGAGIDGAAHLAQSVARILTTPLGSRVMRRDFGSLLPELVDAPFDSAAQLRLFAATAMALMRWEPRIRITRVRIEPAADAGAFVLDIEGTRTDVPAPNALTRLTLPLHFRAAA